MKAVDLKKIVIAMTISLMIVSCGSGSSDKKQSDSSSEVRTGRNQKKLTFEEYQEWFKACGYTVTKNDVFQTFLKKQLGGGQRFAILFSGDPSNGQDAVLVEFESEKDYKTASDAVKNLLLRNGLIGIVAFKDDPFKSAAFAAFKDANQNIAAKNYAAMAQANEVTSGVTFEYIVAAYKNNGFKVEVINDKTDIKSFNEAMGGGKKFAYIYSKEIKDDLQALLIEYTAGDLKFAKRMPSQNPPSLFSGDSEYKRGNICLWPMPEGEGEDVIDFWIGQSE